MKKLSYVLFASLFVASVSCSSVDEEVLPAKSDDQTRIIVNPTGRITGVDAQLTPSRGIIIADLNNNSMVYLRTLTVSVQITDPATGASYADLTEDVGYSILSGKTISHQFNLAFFNHLTLGKAYNVKAAFSYHGSNTSDYPINTVSSNVSSTVVSRLN